MLSFQLGGILIVPDRKLADHIKSERKRERGGERERPVEVFPGTSSSWLGGCPALQGVSGSHRAPPRPLSWKGGPLPGTPRRGLCRRASHAASSSLVCRLTPQPTPRPALSRLRWPLLHPTLLLQPAPASGMTPGLPTPGWECAENQKPPWDSCRAGRRLSLCQMQAQSPPGSLHMPDRQTPCLLACRGRRWPALPGEEQLTQAAGAGRWAFRLLQATSVTREGQPQPPASTRATPSRGDAPNVGDQGQHSQRPSSRHPREGPPCSPGAGALSSHLCPALWLQ